MVDSLAGLDAAQHTQLRRVGWGAWPSAEALELSGTHWL